MDLVRARYLVSPVGSAALAAVEQRMGDELAGLAPHRLIELLARDYGAARAAALAEQLDLRGRARARWGTGLGFLFTAAGLEMSTAPQIAARRARRLAGLGMPVADLTCGIGGEIAACAQAGLPAFGADRDPVAALLAASNVPTAGIVVADAARPPFLLDRMALLLDPSRRTGRGQRTFDPARFSPPWDVAMTLALQAPAAVVKGPPGIAHEALPPQAEVEWLELGHTLHEAAVWVGGDATPGLRRAVLLPSGYELRSDEPQVAVGCRTPGAFVHDPASCVTRAGLVRQLAHRLGAGMLDPQVAYLTTDEAAVDPLCDSFRVLAVERFSFAGLHDAWRAAHRPRLHRGSGR